MSTNDPTPTSPSRARAATGRRTARWVVPATALALGLAMLAGQSYSGDVAGGAVSLGVMTVYAVGLLLFGRRSETVALLGGHTVDERAGSIMLRAQAAAFQIVVVVLVTGFMAALWRGAPDTGTWSALCAVGGAAFIGALVVLGRRS